MQLVVNELLQSKHDQNKLERIVWVDYLNKWCYLVNINKPSFPYRLKVNDIIHRLETKELEKVQEDPLFINVKDAELTDAERKKQDEAWGIIQEIYLTPDIFLPKQRWKLIKKASDKFAVSNKTIYNYLIKYWARGMIKSSLLPDYHLIGKGKREYNQKTGRPAVYSSSIKRTNVNEEWKKIFRASLEKYYFIRSKPSLKYAYQQMLKAYFSIKSNEMDYKVLNVDKPIPTFDQFYYWYRKWNKPEYAIYKREGRREFLQNHRAITGSATEDAMGIGVYAIDGTVGDIYLVSSLDRNKVIGRPLIYLTVDIFSRCIVSVYAGIENMSGDSLRLALANAFSNKKDFCKTKLSMEIGEQDWPIHYLPHTLLADRGSELISDELTSLVENLNIKIQNTGPSRPELKGTCERFFQTLQSHLAPFLPGTVQKDHIQRGGQDYRKKAVLNLREYSQILVRCALYYNNGHYLTDYPLTKHMIEAGVPPNPLKIFEWGLKSGSGLLRSLNYDQIRSNVFPKSQATIDSKGISFKGLYYSCQTALKEKWFSTARTNGSWKTEIRYDPQDMSQIYMHKDRKNYEICTLIEHYEIYQSARIEEVMDLKRSKRQQKAEFQETEMNGKIKLAQEIEEIVRQAKEESKIESNNGNLSKNIKDIRQNRKTEQELVREANRAKSQSHIKAKENDSITISSKQVKNIDLFRQKQKEGLNHENH
ncbi:Mu transposase C-terminal domain-containing protein [Virgibacillus flavescens]|uniref:Mu transposase C-terminal domain-containing protein n=1 Tax=Virgibacillus flavescens TaxID=1611422 RepID=UPI003D344383